MLSHQNCPHCAYTFDGDPSTCPLCGRGLNGNFDEQIIDRKISQQILLETIKSISEAPLDLPIVLDGDSGVGCSKIIEQIKLTLQEDLADLHILSSYPNMVSIHTSPLYPLDRFIHHFFILDDTQTLENRLAKLKRLYEAWEIDATFQHFLEMVLGLIPTNLHREDLPKADEILNHASIDFSKDPLLDDQADQQQAIDALHFQFDFEKGLHSLPPKNNINHSNQDWSLKPNERDDAQEQDDFRNRWQNDWDASLSEQLSESISMQQANATSDSIPIAEPISGSDLHVDRGWLPDEDLEALKEKFTNFKKQKSPAIVAESIDFESHLAMLGNMNFSPISQTILPIIPKEEDDLPETEDDQLKKLADFFIAQSQKKPILMLFFNLQNLDPLASQRVEKFYHILHQEMALVPNQSAKIISILERPSFQIPQKQSFSISAFNQEEIVLLVQKYQSDLDLAIPKNQANIEKMMTASQGNPRQLQSMLQASSQNGGLQEEHMRRITLGHDTGLNLTKFDDFLTFASIAGNVCSLNQIKIISRALDMNPWTQLTHADDLWDEYLNQAIAKQILTLTQNRRFEEEDSYRFLNLDLKDELMQRWVEDFDEESRKQAHAYLASWMEEQEIRSDAQIQVKLNIAEHWVNCGNFEKATLSSFEVGNLLLKRGSIDLALNAFEQARIWLSNLHDWHLHQMIYEKLIQIYDREKQSQKSEFLLQSMIKKAWQLYDYEKLNAYANMLAQIYNQQGLIEQSSWVYQWLSAFPIQRNLDPLKRLKSKNIRSALIQEPITTPKANLPVQTDLEEPPKQENLKQMSISAPLQGIKNDRILDLKDLSMPPDSVIKTLNILIQAGFEAWVVGGSVRDRFLGKDVDDWDLTTNASTDQMVDLFEKVIPTGIEHGTITVIEDDLPIEITTYRIDGEYEDGRRPNSIQFTPLLIEDLKRRDFTMNAIAWNPITQEIVDPFHGLNDIKQNVIRAVGRPLDRFLEDGLRPLRAIRFASVLGFEIENQTWEAILQSIFQLKRVAMERIQVEFVKMLLSNQAFWGLDALLKTGILQEVCPHLCTIEDQDWQLLNIALHRAPPVLEIRLAILLDSLANRQDGSEIFILQTLKCSNQLIHIVSHLLNLRNLSPHISRTDAQIRSLVSQIQVRYINLYWAYRQCVEVAKLGDEQAAIWQALWERIHAIGALEGPQSAKDLAINGKDICLALNIEPGRQVGILLNALLQHVWQNPQNNQRNILLGILPELAQQIC